MTGNPVETNDDLDKGFMYYPYRRSGKADPQWMQKLFYEAPHSHQWKIICEENVMKAFEYSPFIRLLVGALEKAGCPVDLKRNIICEHCDSSMQGGYDVEYNQVVVCKNVDRSRNTPELTIAGGLIHMYDQCVNKYDHKNLEHLACTEIRAANLTRCSFTGSWSMGQSSPFNIKNTHQNCVKFMATNSIVAARKVEVSTAFQAVLKVFDKCYNDLEPIGRRFRSNSDDAYLAEEEGRCLFNIMT